MSKEIKIRSKSGGFTLVEVLVTVVIFSVGLLGLAGLQATGIKLNHSSMLRSQATLLAYDVVDRMRANRINVADYAIAKTGTPPSTPSNMAEQDLGEWRTSLSQELPEGNGWITMNGNRATVVVFWDDARGSAGGDRTMTVVADI